MALGNSYKDRKNRTFVKCILFSYKTYMFHEGKYNLNDFDQIFLVQIKIN